MYEMIAFDMDGTLLNSQHEIAQSSLTAIAEAVARGKKVVLATGRPLSELKTYLPDLTSVRYGVLTSGALVYDFARQKVLTKKVLPKEAVQSIIDLIQAGDIMLVIMLDGQGYVQKQQLERISDYHLTKFQQLYEDTAVMVDDMPRFLVEHEAAFEKINLYHLTTEARRHSRKVLESYPLALVETEVTGLEVTALGADKGQGLSFLCDYLGLEMSTVIAVGDADNDESMIGLAGLGLAMGNANARIKSLADAILADNDHDGCAQAIRDYLLASTNDA